MLRLSRLADYGIVLMCEMVTHKGKTFSARYLSEKTNISETAIMKILKALAKAGVVESIRGPKGGYLISCDPEDISILDLVTAIDGPVAVALCNKEAHTSCKFEANCIAKHGWNKVNDAVLATLAGFTIANFVNLDNKKAKLEEREGNIHANIVATSP